MIYCEINSLASSFYEVLSKTSSDSIQTSKMERFAEIVNCRKPLTLFTKSYILGLELKLLFLEIVYCRFH